MGQDGARAIHGFGLASQFFFRRNLQDLSIGQIATLTGMVKGPTYYDPVRNPDNARTRRDVILNVMMEENVIDEKSALNAKTQPLSDVMLQKNGFNRFPAFVELVRRQLRIEYRDEDLKKNGLKILTTLDPQVQWQVERQLLDTVLGVEESSGTEKIEGAAVVTGRENGEVLAIAGSTKPLVSG